jgi:hypothetical protein
MQRLDDNFIAAVACPGNAALPLDARRDQFRSACAFSSRRYIERYRRDGSSLLACGDPERIYPFVSRRQLTKLLAMAFAMRVDISTVLSHTALQLSLLAGRA